MWNNFGDITKKLAEKAAAAAENIEGQLNESVGATAEALAKSSTVGGKDVTTDRSADLPIIVDDDDDPFGEDDDFYADDDSFDVGMHDDQPAEDQAPENETLGDTLEDPAEKGGNDAFPEDTTLLIEDVPTEQTTGEVEAPVGSTANNDEDRDVDEFEQDRTEISIEEVEQHRADISIQEEGLYDDDDGDEEEEEEEEKMDIKSADPAEIPSGDETAEVPLTLPFQKPSLVENITEVEDTTIVENEHAIETPLHKNQALFVEEDINQPSFTEYPVTAKDDEVSPPNVSPPAEIEENIESAQENIQLSEEPILEEPLEEVQPEQVFDQEEVEVDEDLSLHPTEKGEVVDRYPSLLYNQTSDEESVYVSKEEALGNSFEMGTLKSQVEALESQLAEREKQLKSKATQITTMLEFHETEKKSLESKVKETKEEAKKRITKAKEKVDEMKLKVAEANSRANSAGSASTNQEEIIAALREEGELLAKRQSQMEQSVREARFDMRELKNELESEKTAKEEAEAKNIELERDLKETKTELSAAKQKGGLADKLDSDLLAAKEEREKNASIILGLEAKLKESKSRNSQMQKEMEEAFKDKVAQLEQNSNSIRNEKDTILQDLESKLRTSERESNLREDSLRHEVNELRKRWQDAVRRCDALSIDLQQSSAPLMRQLESTERQNRARAAAWAELESKLRNDLEENIIENEKLTKEKNEMEVEMKKNNRALQGKDSELSVAQSRAEDLGKRLVEVSTELEKNVAEYDKMKTDFKDLEQLMKDNESSQSLDMMNTIQAIEERCNDQVDSLEVELRQERDQRLSLEEKMKDMMERTSEHLDTTKSQNGNVAKKPARNLTDKVNQASILQDTLLGIGANDGDVSDHEDSNDVGSTQDPSSSTSDSFAFIEQLSQALKAAKSERDTLRKQLDDSEERRGVLENESVSNQEAIKALPLLEAKVAQLARETAQKDMEIQALQEDINEVRDMYRSQLTALLGGEDGPSISQNGTHSYPQPQSQPGLSPTNTKPSVTTSSFNGMRTF